MDKMDIYIVKTYYMTLLEKVYHVKAISSTLRRIDVRRSSLSTLTNCCTSRVVPRPPARLALQQRSYRPASQVSLACKWLARLLLGLLLSQFGRRVPGRHSDQVAQDESHQNRITVNGTQHDVICV